MVYYCFALCAWVSSCQVRCATGPTFVDSLAQKKIISMWLVLASSIGTLLEYTDNLLL